MLSGCLYSLQYYATHLLLHRPYLNDPASNAFVICGSAVASMCNLLKLYKRVYTFRRMSSVAPHQVFTAATTLVYMISQEATQPDQQTSANSKKNREDLLLCLAALSALAARMVHARRSYLSVILLMKKYKISLDVLTGNQICACMYGISEYYNMC